MRNENKPLSEKHIDAINKGLIAKQTHAKLTDYQMRFVVPDQGTLKSRSTSWI